MMHRQGPFGKRHKRSCQCQQPVKEIVYPVQNNVVHKCSEEVVKHVHPMHTTVVKHHHIKNEHIYPQTTSVENTYSEVDVFDNGPQTGPNQVAGTMMPEKGCHQHSEKNKFCNKKRRPWF